MKDRCYPLNTDSVHVQYLLDSDDSIRFYLVDVSGQDADQIDVVIPLALTDMLARRCIPVFVTDLTDFAVFRKHEVIFEAVPNIPAARNLMPHLPWESRKSDIIALVRQKWRPVGEMALGNIPTGLSPDEI